MKDLTRIVEALLFSADGPLKIEQVQEVVPAADAEALADACAELGRFYTDSGRAFGVVRIAGGYQLLTVPEVAVEVERFLMGRRRQRLSRAALEVLAVIAYKQPVTRGEVETIRGVDCGGVFRTLLERRLVVVKGRGQGIGHPLLYGTGDHFLEHFGIESLRDLPRIEEFEALVDRGAVRDDLVRSGALPLAEAPEEVFVESTEEPRVEPTAEAVEEALMEDPVDAPPEALVDALAEAGDPSEGAEVQA